MKLFIVNGKSFTKKDVADAYSVAVGIEDGLRGGYGRCPSVETSIVDDEKDIALIRSVVNYAHGEDVAILKAVIK